MPHPVLQMKTANYAAAAAVFLSDHHVWPVGFESILAKE
jgi:hypothetical protein